MSFRKLAGVVVWIAAALTSAYPADSFAVTIAELETQARPALSATNAAWIAAQGKSVRNTNALDVNALLASARAVIKPSNPALTEQSAAALVAMVLADLQRSEAAEASALKAEIDKTNQARNALRELMSTLRGHDRLTALKERLSALATDLSAFSQQSALELQAAVQKQQQAAQTISQLLAKIHATTATIVANLEG